MSISGDIYRIYPISDIMTLNTSIQIQELIYIYIYLSYNNTSSYIYIILDILQLLQSSTQLGTVTIAPIKMVKLGMVYGIDIDWHCRG